MKWRLFFVLTFFSGGCLQGQNSDSLRNIWNDRGASDSSRFAAMKELIMQTYFFTQPDTAFQLAQQLFDFAERRGAKDGMASALGTLGGTYWVRGEYVKALSYFERGLAIQEELNDKMGIAGSLSNMGIIYEGQGYYPKALELYQRSLKIYEELNNKSGEARALNNIGNIYFAQDKFAQALENYRRSADIKEASGMIRDAGRSLGNIGGVYIEMKEYEKALGYFQRSLAIAEELNDAGSIGRYMNNMGFIYFKMGDYSSAMKYYQKGLEVAEKVGNTDLSSACLGNIGKAYSKLGNPSEAIGSCLRSLEIAKSVASLEQQREALECLYHACKESGKPSDALGYYEQMVSIQDSLFNVENTRKLTRLEMQYDFDKKEAAAKAEQEKKDALAQEKLQRQKLVRNGFMGGFALVALFAGIFFKQRNRIGSEKARSEALLLNILPEEVADELKEKGEAEAKLIDQATVLFTDFKGFTVLSEKLSPKELVKNLHDCFSAFDQICEEHGLEKIKTIGDAYMAAGGLPTPNNTHAIDVVRAALKMRDFIAVGKQRKIEKGLPYFEIRIGVHTGPVVAGIVGVKKFQYDIWGDTVNTASRMESHGEAGKVNISATTYELIRDDASFTFVCRGTSEVKGKGDMEMFFVSV